MDITSYLLGKNASGGGGGGLNWATLGYNNTPQSIIDGYNYAKEIQQNWVPAQSLLQKFRDDTNLIYMPLVDTSIATTTKYMFQDCTKLTDVALFNTSNVTDMERMFSGCSQLVSIPQFDTSKVVNMMYTFYYSANLSDESLDNILKMCINVSNDFAYQKKLNYVINPEYYPTAKIQSLPSYQDFLDAGWTLGY